MRSAFSTSSVQDNGHGGRWTLRGQQLLFYGPPRAIAVQRAAWRRDAEDERLELTIATQGLWLRLNEVVELRVELAALSGLRVVEGFNLSFQRRGNAFVEDVHITGAVLPDSA